MTTLEVALAGAAVKEASGPAKALISKLKRDHYDRLVVEYCNCFQSHIESSYERCRLVKNVLYRDNSVELRKQYVNVHFSKFDEQIFDTDVIEDVLDGERILISGTAGAGKTMFMKWLTLSLIDSIPNHQRIPLFLELRYLTEDSLKTGLVEYILSSTAKAEKRVSIDRFKIGLELGQFVLVMDAVDEVKPTLREKVLEEVRRFLGDYPKCPVLVSSRPDEQLESLQELSVYKTINMTKDQIIDVIGKLEFDGEVKSRLISQLDDGLFDKHEEFLSNPLLATIMLLNFDHSADIPTRLTSFYRQAFDALYQRHDAAKGAYRRGHYAGLPLDEYEKVFSAFCFDSFMDSKVQFTDSELLDYFRSAADYYSIKSDPSLLVDDAMKSVCVIQREGLDNVFAHRSFQEYFTALFLSRYREDDFPKQMDETVLGWQSNNVLRMLLEMAPEAVEQEWLEPKIRGVLEGIRRVKPDTLSGSTKIFKALYLTIRVDIDNGSIIGFSGNSYPNITSAGNWLSSVGLAYTPSIRLSREIFVFRQIFDSLENYVGRHEGCPSFASLSDRIVYDGEDEDRRRSIEFSPKDMQWLIHSGLPESLRKVRDELMAFHGQLVQRIQGRAEAMSRLRTRRRSGLSRLKRG